MPKLVQKGMTKTIAGMAVPMMIGTVAINM
jgi:hypothetical protein